jgi:SAM-dependent methyltransferase
MAEPPPVTWIERSFGRRAFGSDAANYDAARPGYPDWVFEELAARGLVPGAAAFEIGPGTGTATRMLLQAAASVTAVEPDARLASFLRQRSPEPDLDVRVGTFEDADLPEGAFDLGLAATSFHWLDEDAALTKIARLLKPGGCWAALWNIFGDDSRPDPFHDATTHVVGGVYSPSATAGGVNFGLDVEQRQAALTRAGAFEPFEVRIERWPLVLDPDETVALYATYSNVQIRPDRDAVLGELRRIAEREFGGRVVRNMTTALFTSRRR